MCLKYILDAIGDKSDNNELSDRTSFCLCELASLIYSTGVSSREACCCLNPDEAGDYGRISFILSAFYGATHYDLSWKEVGKVAVLRIYTASVYGAALGTELVYTAIIDVLSYVRSSRNV